jgi:hypothetical protein
MAVKKTPRKKTEIAEAPKASKAPAKKAVPAKDVKAAPVKPAAKKPVEKKAAVTQAKPETRPGRKPKAATTPEPVTTVQAKPAPKPAPKAEAKADSRSKVASPQLADVPAVGLSPLVEAILAAIREGRALEFIFADTEANAPRTFEPRQLTFDALSQAWNVWGWDRRYNAERFHRVDLLGEVNPVEGVGRAAQGPYAEGTPANQIGGWLGGEPIVVKATLMKQWVFAVKQAPPAFPNFRMEEQGDGQALVTFSATDLRAIARWIMQFGDGVQVQEPARLQDRIKQVAAVWMGRDRLPAVSAPSRHESARHEPRHESARHEPRSEAKPEAKPTPRPESPQESRRRDARPPREARPEREARPREQDDEAPKGKPGKLEVIRFDRL